MSDGLRAMMQAARSRPLDFPVSMYVGSLAVTGRIAPASLWRQVTERAVEGDAERRMGARKLGSTRRREHITHVLAGFRSDLDRIGDMGKVVDEVTLIDVRAFPIVGTAGTRSGGLALPIARVPLASVDMWWVAEGEDIGGSDGPGFGIGIGVAVPLD